MILRAPALIHTILSEIKILTSLTVKLSLKALAGDGDKTERGVQMPERKKLARSIA